MQKITMLTFMGLALLFLEEAKAEYYYYGGGGNISYSTNSVMPGYHYSGWERGWQPGPSSHERYYMARDAAWANGPYPQRFTQGGNFPGGQVYDANVHTSFGDFYSREHASNYLARRFAQDHSLNYKDRVKMSRELYDHQHRRGRD